MPAVGSSRNTTSGSWISASQGEPLLPAAGERAGGLFDAVADRRQFENVGDSRDEPRLRKPVDPPVELQVLAHGEIGIELNFCDM